MRSALVKRREGVSRREAHVEELVDIDEYGAALESYTFLMSGECQDAEVEHRGD